jgi:hypothetical protein
MSAALDGDKPKRKRAPKAMNGAGEKVNGMGEYDGEIASLQTEVASLKETVGKLDLKVDKILTWVDEEIGARKARAEMEERQANNRANTAQGVTLTWTKLGVLVGAVGALATVVTIFVRGGV